MQSSDMGFIESVKFMPLPQYDTTLLSRAGGRTMTHAHKRPRELCTPPRASRTGYNSHLCAPKIGIFLVSMAQMLFMPQPFAGGEHFSLASRLARALTCTCSPP